MSTDRWMDKEIWIILSHKKEWNKIICSNMDELRDYHTKSDRKTDIIWYCLYVESKNKVHKWMYKQNRNRLTDTENKLMVTKAGNKLGVWD